MPDVERIEWSETELAHVRRGVALGALTAVLAGDEDFLDLCQSVRQGQRSAADIASVRRGRGREVLSKLLQMQDASVAVGVRSGLSERQAIAQALINAGATAIWIEREPDGSRRRWRSEGTRYREAAGILVAEICSRCTKTGCTQKIDRDRRFCSAHQYRAALHRRADQEAVRHLLDRAAEALGI